MALYKEIEPAPFEAFEVIDLSGEFHGKELIELEGGEVAMVDTGTATVGDYRKDGQYIAKAAFEAKYTRVTAASQDSPVAGPLDQ